LEDCVVLAPHYVQKYSIQEFKEYFFVAFPGVIFFPGVS
jgi:hypothetical protein